MTDPTEPGPWEEADWGEGPMQVRWLPFILPKRFWEYVRWPSESPTDRAQLQAALDREER